MVEDTEHPEIPVVELPKLEFYLNHDLMIGQPFALHMNRDIIKRIADKAEGWEYIRPECAFGKLESFIIQNFNPPNASGVSKVVLAGKNAANFDLRFLRKLPGWNDRIFRHRLVDPTVYYWHSQTDIVPPETKTCCERAGIEVGNQHNAVNDCRVVIELIRRGPQYAARQVVYPNS